MTRLSLFSRLVSILLFITSGIGVFFLGTFFSNIQNFSNVQQFLKTIPETNPDYLGEIVSKDGNLLTIKYFEDKNTPLGHLSNTKERLDFLKKASIEEKIKIMETLKQKVLGTTTILVPLDTPLFLKREFPEPISFLDLKKGDFIVVWGNLNNKGQVVSNFIMSANPTKYEQK